MRWQTSYCPAIPGGSEGCIISATHCARRPERCKEGSQGPDDAGDEVYLACDGSQPLFRHRCCCLDAPQLGAYAEDLVLWDGHRDRGRVKLDECSDPIQVEACLGLVPRQREADKAQPQRSTNKRHRHADKDRARYGTQQNKKETDKDTHGRERELFFKVCEKYQVRPEDVVSVL